MIEVGVEASAWIDDQIQRVAEQSRKDYGIPRVLSRRQYVEQILVDLKLGRLVQIDEVDARLDAGNRAFNELHGTLEATLGALLTVAEQLAVVHAKAISQSRNNEVAGIETRYERLAGGTPRMVFDYVADGGQHREELFPIEIAPECARLLEAKLENMPGVKNVPAPNIKSALEETLE